MLDFWAHFKLFKSRHKNSNKHLDIKKKINKLRKQRNMNLKAKPWKSWKYKNPASLNKKISSSEKNSFTQLSQSLRKLAQEIPSPNSSKQLHSAIFFDLSLSFSAPISLGNGILRTVKLHSRRRQNKAANG